MTRVELNGEKMLTKEIAHEYIKWKLKLPEYYGKNLDALWDILSSWDKDIKIIIVNTDYLIQSLGQYGQSIIEVFQEAEKENHHIDLATIS